MLFIIFAVSQALIKGGLGLALIREKEITEADKTTVFYFNIIVSIFLYLVLWVAAPKISTFFERNELILLTRLMGLELIFASLTIVQISILNRELKFKALGIIDIISGVGVVITSVLLAYFDYGVIALGVRYILGSFLSSILLFSYNPWLPKGFIKKSSFKNYFLLVQMSCFYH